MRDRQCVTYMVLKDFALDLHAEVHDLTGAAYSLKEQFKNKYKWNKHGRLRYFRWWVREIVRDDRGVLSNLTKLNCIRNLEITIEFSMFDFPALDSTILPASLESKDFRKDGGSLTLNTQKQQYGGIMRIIHRLVRLHQKWI